MNFAQTSALDGSGYGYWRHLYLDADPILVSAAGRIHQAEPDPGWLNHIRPGLIEAAQRMLETIGPEGLAICRDLSGNSGTHRWSSNAMDQIGFGHMDAYVNAWTYRALRNAAALLRPAGEQELAAHCAARVAGWRSRDGALHDAAYMWVNGVACAFGVLEDGIARRALTRLEALRERLGLRDAPLGLPCNLRSIPDADQPLQVTANAVASQLELFCNGSIIPFSMEYYIRALAIHGLKDRARRLAQDMEQGYLADAFSPGTAEGAEFFAWDGMACGYEGTFGPNFGPMYALAIERGLIKPPDPEWWPADG